MRVLVAEDDPKIAQFIVNGLHEEGHEVELTEDGEAALAAARRVAPPFDAMVLDIRLPKRSGLDVLQELRDNGSSLPVLALSALDAVDDRVRGLRAGADDYLIKPFAFDELVARLLALTRRCNAPAEPTRLSYADLTLDRLTRTVHRGAAPIELQPKEFALLAYLLSHPGRPVTKAMILEHVWGWTFDPRTNVVDVLIFRLRNKIDRGADPKLIHTLRGIGYVLRAA